MLLSFVKDNTVNSFSVWASTTFIDNPMVFVAKMLDSLFLYCWCALNDWLCQIEPVHQPEMSFWSELLRNSCHLFVVRVNLSDELNWGLHQLFVLLKGSIFNCESFSRVVNSCIYWCQIFIFLCQLLEIFLHFFLTVFTFSLVPFLSVTLLPYLLNFNFQIIVLLLSSLKVNLLLVDLQ